MSFAEALLYQNLLKTVGMWLLTKTIFNRSTRTSWRLLSASSSSVLACATNLHVYVDYNQFQHVDKQSGETYQIYEHWCQTLNRQQVGYYNTIEEFQVLLLIVCLQQRNSKIIVHMTAGSNQTVIAWFVLGNVFSIKVQMYGLHEDILNSLGQL